jgi:3-polyprenyl-4-hydroxybenzoate decarboxylase
MKILSLLIRFQADKDLIIQTKIRGSSLDPSSDQKKLQTAKMGIDATKPLSMRPEGFELAKIPKIDKIKLDKYFK